MSFFLSTYAYDLARGDDICKPVLNVMYRSCWENAEFILMDSRIIPSGFNHRKSRWCHRRLQPLTMFHVIAYTNFSVFDPSLIVTSSSPLDSREQYGRFGGKQWLGRVLKTADPSFSNPKIITTMGCSSSSIRQPRIVRCFSN